LFELSDVALNFILVIGGITALFMGILGIVSNDIKKVIAYSTLSQLGYMTVALGVSAYSAAIFHLMTHAFFKALLFLGSGSVIIAMHHSKDMRWMGGLHKYMPITSITFLLATFALVAVPLFSGFYSKDAIIHASHASHLPAAGFASFAVTAGVFITAVYAFREYFLVFMGKPRWDQDPEVIAGRQEPCHPKESPRVVTVPLIILAVLSVGVGFFTMMPVLFGSLFDDSIFVNLAQHPAMTELRDAIVGPGAMALEAFVGLPLYLMLAGVLVAWYCYIVNPGLPARIARAIQPVYNVLVNKYYMDWLWINVGAGAARLVGRGLYHGGDRGIIETGIVNASWRLVGWTAGVTRWFQSGYLYHYALVMVLGVFVLMSYFIWLA
ncbi:MAG: proton-conducting transporter membrane subunit, partial [Ottowia sp.]